MNTGQTVIYEYETPNIWYWVDVSMINTKTYKEMIENLGPIRVGSKFAYFYVRDRIYFPNEEDRLIFLIKWAK